MITKNEAKKLRNALKTQFPTLKFTVRLVTSYLEVSSAEWGADVENIELYNQVEIVAKKYDAKVKW